MGNGDTSNNNIPTSILPIDFTAISNEVEKLSVDPFLEKFNASKLDQLKDYPPPPPVINLIQGTDSFPIMTLKSISLWQGKAKSKKTTALALTLASFITRTQNSDNIRFERAMDGTVIFFDTEQGESYAARTMRLILKMAGLKTSPNLIYSNLREFPTTEKLQIIRTGIENTPNVKIVVIDGIVDLMVDFMESKEGSDVVTELLNLSSVYNIHIAGVLHQNKKDKNARAHVGGLFSQKCETEISAEVSPQDKCRSIITNENSRGLYFEPFTIEWQKAPDSLPHICQDIQTLPLVEAKRTKQLETELQKAKEIFRDSQSLTHGEFIKKVMEKYGNQKGTAKNWLDKWQDLKIVKHEGDQYILDLILPSRLVLVGGTDV